jgi:hypothetical protein
MSATVTRLKTTTQNLSNKVYAIGGKHIAGQHSLSLGEIVALAIAGVMVFMPAVWKQMPLVGKYGSVTIAFVILIVAMVLT